MDFYTYTTNQDACSKAGVIQDAETFYRLALAEAYAVRSAQFYYQLRNERDWEQARRPYYNVWPSIVPMLIRLNLDLDSSLVNLPMPALCIRLPKYNNPLTFEWKGETLPIRCMLLGDMDDGDGISVLIDLDEKEDGIAFSAPVYTYQNFRREKGLTVEASLREAGHDDSAGTGIQIPISLVNDCVRLCCSLCLLENDPSVIEPDVLSKDRARFEQSGDDKYIDKAHRRGKVGWNVGRQIEVAPHYRRPHMMLAWTGAGRAVPKVVPRRGSVVHREKVEKVPSGFGG